MTIDDADKEMAAGFGAALEITEAIVDSMNEREILKVWNGPTSVCNKAKILQFAADIESRLRAESAQEPGHGNDRVYESEFWLDAHHKSMQGLFPHNNDSVCAGCKQPIPAGEIYRCYDCANPFHRLCCRKHNSTIAAPVAKPAAQDCVLEMLKEWNRSAQGDGIDGRELKRLVLKTEKVLFTSQPAAQEYVSAPREPTEAMIAAGRKVFDAYTDKSTDEQIADEYRAMVLAAHKEPQK